jgi:NADP-dependent 3-hydroxy acid dehydrogenase YdfG
MKTLITGATAGIGRATAELFANDGADLVLGARSADKLESFASTLDENYEGEVVASPVDVSEELSVAAFVEEATDTLDGLDVVVHAAGVERAYGSKIEAVSPEDFRVMTETNVFGTYYVAHEAIPYLRSSEGTLVLLGSFAGQYPRPASPVYAATKWWVRGFGRSVQAEVGDDGVSVSIVNPSEVRTEWKGSDDEPPLKEAFAAGEATDPKDIAEAIRFVSTRETPNSVVELDLYRRDKLGEF